MTARCIYCLQSHDEPFDKAHIFPESTFGDHEYLFLNNGEVCSSCNNRLSRLEQKFQVSLGLLGLFVGTGVSKKGKPTTVNAPGLRWTANPGDPRVTINTGSVPLRGTDGTVVKPAKRPESISVVYKGQSDEGHEFSIAHGFRFDTIARMLAKIGFETLCYEEGPEYCCDNRWKNVRAFILKGLGPRSFAVPIEWSIALPSDGPPRLPKGIRLVHIDDPERGAEAKHYIMGSIGIGAPFMVDLSPDNVVLARFFEKQPEAGALALLLTVGKR